MNTIPTITIEDISRAVSLQNFQRGQKYFSQKRVCDMRRQEMMLKGRCQGSEAEAAEATHPREAIAIYEKHIEGLIRRRGRESYQQASAYLVRVRDVREKLGEHEEWMSYISGIQEQNRSLRALKEEMANAGLM